MLGEEEEEEEVGVIKSTGAAPQIQFSSSPTSKQRVVCWLNWCCGSFQVGVMRATSPEASQLTHDHVTHVSFCLFGRRCQNVPTGDRSHVKVSPPKELCCCRGDIRGKVYFP